MYVCMYTVAVHIPFWQLQPDLPSSHVLQLGNRNPSLHFVHFVLYFMSQVAQFLPALQAEKEHAGFYSKAKEIP